jgi:hypothetical protein
MGLFRRVRDFFDRDDDEKRKEEERQQESREQQTATEAATATTDTPVESPPMPEPVVSEPAPGVVSETVTASAPAAETTGSAAGTAAAAMPAAEPVAEPAVSTADTVGVSEVVVNEGTVTGVGLERTYTTKAGDTLESIAAYFYGAEVHRQRLLDDNPDLNLEQHGSSLPGGIRIRVGEDVARGDTVGGSSTA